MLRSVKKVILLSTSLVALSWLALAPAHADDLTKKVPTKRVVVIRQPVQKPIKSSSVALAKLDCSPVIYEYNGKTETKTVCSPPWTAPKAGAESGPSGSTTSSTQQ